ncbi:MAG: hypothetical protein QXX93_02265 [Desulfurococcaceae archaeon]
MIHSLALILVSLVSMVLQHGVKSSGKYRLDILAAISGGAGVMFLVDSALNDELVISINEEFVVLTVLLVITALILWLVSLLYLSVKSKVSK